MSGGPDEPIHGGAGPPDTPFLLLPIIGSVSDMPLILHIIGNVLADLLVICFAAGLIVRFIAWARKAVNGSGKPVRQPRHVGRDWSDDVPSPRRRRERDDDPMHPLFRRKR